jgi:hypothetical protein
MMRFMGRFSIDASPVSLVLKDWAASMPDISLVVVQELPV